MKFDKIYWEKKKKSIGYKFEKFLIEFLGVLWFASWLSCIWIKEYRWNLFFTGLLFISISTIITLTHKALETIANSEEKK